MDGGDPPRPSHGLLMQMQQMQAQSASTQISTSLVSLYRHLHGTDFRSPAAVPFSQQHHHHFLHQQAQEHHHHPHQQQKQQQTHHPFPHPHQEQQQQQQQQLRQDNDTRNQNTGKFVLAVAWSIDGKLLACSTMDGTVGVFDVSRGKLLHLLEGHHMPVRSLVFSPVDPYVLFTASDDKHVRIYDAKNNGLICAMSGHGSWVLSVDASPDGSALATGSSDRTVRLWDLSMRASVQTVTDHTDQVWGVAFRPPGGEGIRAGRLAAVSDDKSINLYDFS